VGSIPTLAIRCLPCTWRVFGSSTLTTKKRLLGSVWATTRAAVAKCEAVIGETVEPDSCLEVELRRPRFSKGESEVFLFEPATRTRVVRTASCVNMIPCAMLQERIFTQERVTGSEKSLLDEILHI